MEKHKKLSNNKFELYINLISERLRDFVTNNNIRIDYICPILRSGAVPAVYIANKLNIIKFAPIQVKHIEYKNGINDYAELFMPFDGLNITKKEPVFLLVDGTCASGESSKICIEKFTKRYQNAKILYICVAKQYNSQTFQGKVIYEDCGFYYNGSNNFTKEKCKELGIEYNIPLYSWEILENERNHPDDLEENIYF